MSLQNRKRLTDLENELNVAGGKGQLRTLGGHVHTAIFKMDNQQGPIIKHTELCSRLCASQDGEEFGERVDHVYV